MPLCATCGKDVCKPCTPANKNDPAPRSILVASDWELRRPSHRHRLAIKVAGLGRSRRALLDWMAFVVFSYVAAGGVIVWPNGRKFDVPDTLIDDAFNDGGARWVSDFLLLKDALPRQRTSKKVLPRLRLLDLAVRLAPHFGGKNFGR